MSSFVTRSCTDNKCRRSRYPSLSKGQNGHGHYCLLVGKPCTSRLRCVITLGYLQCEMLSFKTEPSYGIDALLLLLAALVSLPSATNGGNKASFRSLRRHCSSEVSNKTGKINHQHYSSTLRATPRVSLWLDTVRSLQPSEKQRLLPGSTCLHSH